MCIRDDGNREDGPYRMGRACDVVFPVFQGIVLVFAGRLNR